MTVGSWKLKSIPFKETSKERNNPSFQNIYFFISFKIIVQKEISKNTPVMSFDIFQKKIFGIVYLGYKQFYCRYLVLLQQLLRAI